MYWRMYLSMYAYICMYQYTYAYVHLPIHICKCVYLHKYVISQQQPGGGQAIGDLSITQALGMARDQFMRTIASNPRGDGY
jgi:hypothetical protein